MEPVNESTSGSLKWLVLPTLAAEVVLSGIMLGCYALFAALRQDILLGAALGTLGPLHGIFQAIWIVHALGLGKALNANALVQLISFRHFGRLDLDDFPLSHLYLKRTFTAAITPAGIDHLAVPSTGFFTLVLGESA